MRVADVSQAPQELQEQAAAVVALYQMYRAHAGPTIDEVRQAAGELGELFPAANRRSGVRENPSLGVLPERQASNPAAATVSEETGQRIARAVEALVDLVAVHFGVPNPLVEEEYVGPDQDGESDSQ